MKELINLQLMMFALIITGLILKKVGVVGKEAQKGMTNLVIDLILPCNIIYSFMIKFSSKIAQSTGTPSFFMHPAEAFHGDLGII